VGEFEQMICRCQYPKIHQLKTDLTSCKQGVLEVVEFYSKITEMWSELESYAKFHIVHAINVNVELETKL